LAQAKKKEKGERKGFFELMEKEKKKNRADYTAAAAARGDRGHRRGRGPLFGCVERKGGSFYHLTRQMGNEEGESHPCRENEQSTSIFVGGSGGRLEHLRGGKKKRGRVVQSL